MAKLTKHTMWLFAGDFQRLGDFYPDFGASIIVRQLIRKHLEDLESKVDSKLPNVEVKDIE